jgi:hypothetical protein
MIVDKSSKTKSIIVPGVSHLELAQMPLIV